MSENDDNIYRHFPEKFIIFPSNVLNTFGLLLPQEHISIKREREKGIIIIKDHMHCQILDHSQIKFLNKW